MGARKALLHWCQNQIGQKFGVLVNDFGKSWRDGNAFLAIINSIQPGAWRIIRIWGRGRFRVLGYDGHSFNIWNCVRLWVLGRYI